MPMMKHLTMTTRKALAIFALGFFIITPVAVSAAIVADPIQAVNDTDQGFGTATNGGNVRTVCQSFKAENNNIEQVNVNIRAGFAYIPLFRDIGLSITSGNCLSEGGSILAQHVLDETEYNAHMESAPTLFEWTLGSPITVTVGTTYYLNVRDVDACNNCYTTSKSTNDTYSDGILKTDGWNDGTDVHTVSGDLFFAIWGENSAVDSGTHTPPVTVIYSPPDGQQVDASAFVDGLDVRAYSNVLSASETASNVNFNWFLLSDGTLRAFSLTIPANSLYSSSGYLASRTRLHTVGTVQNGVYEIRARSCWGTSCGVTTINHITVTGGATGTSETIVGATNDPFPTWDGNWSHFGAWVGSVAGWLFVPGSIQNFDPSPLFELFQSRWPLAYVFGPIAQWQDGFAAGSSCPLPSFFGNSLFGISVPSFNLCTTLSAAGTAIDANTFVANIFQWVIYLGGVFVAFEVAKSIIKIKK